MVRAFNSLFHLVLTTNLWLSFPLIISLGKSFPLIISLSSHNHPMMWLLTPSAFCDEAAASSLDSQYHTTSKWLSSGRLTPEPMLLTYMGSSSDCIRETQINLVGHEQHFLMKYKRKSIKYIRIEVSVCPSQ